MASSSAATPSPLPLPPPSSLVPTITPAALASLAIYNPSLGTTDETVHEQIVFYTSRKAAVTENDKLRQIGLAQGVVEFARGFSKSGNLSSVETAKARIVTLEIEEPGWWILAQIDLTYIHNPTPHPPTAEYTAREVSPPLLLLAQLRQCYSQFRFHYGSFASNLSTLGRAAFCKRLEKWWTRWAWRRWEVMLNGSPGIEVWDAAIKMAGGKPAREVGSEEREFLQGWAEKQKARGMVDMVVSRFGEYVEDEEEVDNSARTGGSGFWFWPSTGKFVSSSSKPLTGGGKTQDKPNVIMPQDGCVFRGTGTLETNSVRDIATYLSALYLYGDESFSINSTGIRRKKRRKRPRGLAHVRSFSALVTSSPSSVESSPRISSSTIRPISEEPGNHSSTTSRFKPREDEERRGRTPEVGTEERTKKRSQSTTNAKILNLFTFGWGGNSSSQPSQQSTSSGAQNSSIRGLLHTALTPPPSEGSGGETGIEHTNGPANPKPKDQPTRKTRGTFLVGFQGDLEVEDLEDEYDEGGGRITTRTVWLQKKAEPAEEPVKGEEIESAHNDENEDDKNSDSGDGRRHSGASTIKQTNFEEFRIVVYTNHPFIFAFIFNSQASHLTNPSFYRGLHHQLSPLQKLLVSSSSSSSSSAAKESLQTHASSTPPSPKPPFHVLYDPNTGTLNSTLPPIPHPGPDVDQNWTRTDAIHIHTLILSILTEISGEKNERERSARSTRGWWVCWIRLEKGREGFFVRKAAEKKAEGSMGVGGPGAGVGVDVRRHFEGLFKDAR